MFINSIPEGHSEQSGVMARDEDRPDWPEFVDGVHCHYDIDRATNDITIRIRFQGRMVLQCARCLERVEWPVLGAAIVTLKHASAVEPGADAEDAGVDFLFDDSINEVDISPAIYDEFMTDVPLKPLCSETCAGIAWSGPAETGDTAAIDPRWEALKKLKGRAKT